MAGFGETSPILPPPGARIARNIDGKRVLPLEEREYARKQNNKLGPAVSGPAPA